MEKEKKIWTHTEDGWIGIWITEAAFLAIKRMFGELIMANY